MGDRPPPTLPRRTTSSPAFTSFLTAATSFAPAGASARTRPGGRVSAAAVWDGDALCDRVAGDSARSSQPAINATPPSAPDTAQTATNTFRDEKREFEWNHMRLSFQ